MSILDISNIINVTVTSTPSGLINRNVNLLALFTTETPDNIDPYNFYVGASQVAADYGTNSVTAAMASAVFSQVPNVLTGDGGLVIFPLLSSVSATTGHLVTADISANLSALIAVTNGDLKVTIDSVVHNLANLNFAGCATLADIATVLQAKLLNCTVTATTTQITLTSKKVGTASTIALAAYSGGGTDLNGAGYINGAGATATAGANSTGETISAAVTRTMGTVGYGAVMSNLNIEDAAIEANAAAIQALDLLYFQHFASSDDIAGAITAISTMGENKTRCLLYTPGQTQSNLMKAAYAGRALSVNFTGSKTSQTMELKQLATITPDTGITETLYQQALVAGADLYVSFAGVPSVVSSGGNLYFDQPYSRLALKFDLETAGFDYLRQTNTKVPQTETGMNGLKSAYADVMKQYVTNGYLAPGQWNSSETFGDPQIFVSNITINGYYVYSQPVAQQNVTDRNNRKAPLCQIAAKEAGAIQHSDVIVLVNP